MIRISLLDRFGLVSVEAVGITKPYNQGDRQEANQVKGKDASFDSQAAETRSASEPFPPRGETSYGGKNAASTVFVSCCDNSPSSTHSCHRILTMLNSRVETIEPTPPPIIFVSPCEKNPVQSQNFWVDELAESGQMERLVNGPTWMI